MLVDEAYHPLLSTDCRGLTATLPHLIVARTFAKACVRRRIGYAIAHEDTAAILHKVRRYEVNTVAGGGHGTNARPGRRDEGLSVARLNAGRDGF